jgi:phage tail sheath protein FI
MAEMLSPGVYVREVDNSTFIKSFATTTGHIVLRNCYKGEEMQQTLITTEDELITMFGDPISSIYSHDDLDGTQNYTNVSDSYIDMFSAMGYLKYGSKLYCTRVMAPSATFAGTKLDSTDTWVPFNANSALTLQTEYFGTGDIGDIEDFAAEGDDLIGTDQLWTIANSRGYHGNNIRIGLVNETTQTAILSGGQSSWASNDLYNVVASLDSKLSGAKELLFIVQSKAMGNAPWDTVEYFNVSLEEKAKDDQGVSKFIENRVNQSSKYVKVCLYETLKDADVPTDWLTGDFVQLGGGTDYVGDSIPDAVIIEGYNLTDNPEEIDINLYIDSDKSETVKRMLVEISESRMDAMAIIDVPRTKVLNNKGNEATDMIEWRKGISFPGFNQNTSYAALYGNWLEVYDKWNGKYRWVPASGFMAGIYANNDLVTDAWFAPAGLNRGMLTGVRRLAWNPTKGARDLMYMSGINAIVSFAGKGKIVWGQKTLLDKASAFDRVNVRRLFLTIEKAISESSKYFVFQPNDRFTRRQLIAMIDPYLADVKARRGVYDFAVICDETNNSNERIDRNELWVDIYIQPTRAAEMIQLTFIATKTGASFTEGY